MVNIDNRVGELASNLNFKMLKDVERYYSNQYNIDFSVDVVLRFRTPQDYNGKDNPTLGDIRGTTITILFKEKQRKPYTNDFVSWILMHEYRHRMQILIPALHKEIAKEAKYLRKRFPPRDFPDIDWFEEISDNDADFFAAETTRISLPRRRYER